MKVKGHKKYYATYSTLIALFLIVAFQNCDMKTLEPLVTSGDYAIFQLHGVTSDQVTSILWRIIEITHYSQHSSHSQHSTGKSPTITVSWDNIVNRRYSYTEYAMRSNYFVEAFVKLKEQNCITYINLPITPLQYNNQKSSQSLEVETSPIDSSSASIASLDFKDHLTLVPPLLIDPYSHTIKATNDSYTFKDYFPVGTTVNFSVNEETASTYHWNIEKLFQSDEEVVVNANEKQNFSHTFATMGLYNVELGYYIDKNILIGICTGEEEAIEIIFGDASFEDHTPAEILEHPHLNYIRPATSNHKITLLKEREKSTTISTTNTDIDTDIETRYESFKDYDIIYYKYNRTSHSKVIDVNIQNVTSGMRCFFDDQPVETSEEFCTEMACPDDDPNCNTCGMDTTYDFRDSLTPLDSCNGNVYDMTTLDTDTTECTDAIVLFGFAVNSEDEPDPMPFYKHCPADSQYCYFGPEISRPDHHHCSL